MSARRAVLFFAAFGMLAALAACGKESAPEEEIIILPDGDASEGDRDADSLPAPPAWPAARADRTLDFTSQAVTLADYRQVDQAETGGGEWRITNAGLSQTATDLAGLDAAPDADTSELLSTTLFEGRRAVDPYALEVVLDAPASTRQGAFYLSFAEGAATLHLCFDASCGGPFIRFKEAGLAPTSARLTEFPPDSEPLALRVQAPSGLIHVTLNGTLLVSASRTLSLSGYIGLGVYREAGLHVRRLSLWGKLGEERYAAETAPLSIGLRGHGPSDAANPFPENTLAAFRAGYSDGASLVLADIRASADGVPVVIADDTLERTTDCTGAVAAHTAAELATCIAVKGSGYAGESLYVPTLDGLLRDMPGLRWVFLIHPSGARDADEALIARTAEILLDHGAIHSGNLRRDSLLALPDQSLLSYAATLYSDLALCHYSESPDPSDITSAMERGLTSVIVPGDKLTTELTAQAVSASFPLWTLGLESVESMRLWRGRGVSAFITAHPERAAGLAWD